MAGNVGTGNCHVLDLALLDLADEAAVADFLDLAALAGILEQGEERKDQHEDDGPEGEGPDVRIHERSRR